MTAICPTDNGDDREKSRLLSVIERFLEQSSSTPYVGEVFERAVIEMCRRMAEPGFASWKRTFSQLEHQSDPDLFANVAAVLVSTHPYVSPEAKIRLRGQKMFNEMLEAAGGLYRQEEVAQLLGITVAAVRKRQQAKRLLGVFRGDHVHYPVWQFEEGAVLPHFEEALKALDVSDPGKVRFFLTPDEELKGRPIDSLRKGTHVELVMRKARQLGTQVAT